MAASVVTVPATPTSLAARLVRRSGRSRARRSQRGHLGGGRRVGVQAALRHPHAADVEARRIDYAVRASEHQLGRAAADVADERARHRVEPRRDTAVGELGLLPAREEPRLEAVPRPTSARNSRPFAASRTALVAVASTRSASSSARPGGVAVEHGVHPIHRRIGEAPVGVDPVAEPGDLEQALGLVQLRAADVGHQEPGRVRPHIHRADTHHRRSLGFSIDH